MRRAALDEFEPNINYDDLENLSSPILFTLASDNLYFSGIEIEGFSSKVFGRTIA